MEELYTENQSAILSKLTKLIGEDNLSLDDATKLIYGKDLTQNYSPDPLAIVFPNNEQDVLTIIQLANKYQISLVPSGGRTGYSGGAVAENKELVVSFEKMNRIISFNPDDRQLSCEAGVTTKIIQEFAAKHGLYYPIDYAAVDKCQIGGNIATNAGGIHVIRYGSTSKWVAGLKVVTGNGNMLELNYGLIKNSSGYDLRHLFIGSEGTLGFITEATIQLTLPPKHIKTVFCCVSDKKYLIKILNTFRDVVPIIAFEFFDEAACQEVSLATQQQSPFTKTSAYYVLIDYESDPENDKAAAVAINTCKSNDTIFDCLIAKDEKEKEYFWRFRIEISRTLAKYSPYKYDIAVLPSKIANFMQVINELFGDIYSDLKIVWWGHVGDGNLHLNILKPVNISKEEFFVRCGHASEQVYKLIQQYRGTISAEHGIGLLKKPFLNYSKTTEEIAYFRAIKKIFDPNNIMNPGKLI